MTAHFPKTHEICGAIALQDSTTMTCGLGTGKNNLFFSSLFNIHSHRNLGNPLKFNKINHVIKRILRLSIHWRDSVFRQIHLIAKGFSIMKHYKMAFLQSMKA